MGDIPNFFRLKLEFCFPATERFSKGQIDLSRCRDLLLIRKIENLFCGKKWTEISLSDVENNLQDDMSVLINCGELNFLQNALPFFLSSAFISIYSHLDFFDSVVGLIDMDRQKFDRPQKKRFEEIYKNLNSMQISCIIDLINWTRSPDGIRLAPFTFSDNGAVLALKFWTEKMVSRFD